MDWQFVDGFFSADLPDYETVLTHVNMAINLIDKPASL
jgi:hypothetical protein